jgi:hypothetical protein
LGTVAAGSNIATAKGALEPLARDPGLHDPGEEEAEDERPPDLPGHLEGVPEPLADQVEGVDQLFRASSMS